MFWGVLAGMKRKNPEKKEKGIPVWLLLLAGVSLAVVSLLVQPFQQAGERENSKALQTEEISQENPEEYHSSENRELLEIEELDLVIATLQEEYDRSDSDLKEVLEKVHHLQNRQEALQKELETLQAVTEFKLLKADRLVLMQKKSQELRAIHRELEQIRTVRETLQRQTDEKGSQLETLLDQRALLWQDLLEIQQTEASSDFREGGSPRKNALIDGKSMWAREGLLENSGGLNSDQDQKKACLPYALDEIDEDAALSASLDWLVPASGSLSAGTWAYPSGSMHLGMDLALPLYTPLKAPADSIVLYANAPVESTGGYLGNWSGWPQGGGNTLALAVNVRGRLYAVTFAHLSSSLRVKPGQTIKQSDIIALSGNSGNSTGPHTHIEVFEIHVSLQELVSFFSRSADFSFGCGFSQPGSSAIGTRVRPEELFFT